MIKYLFSICVLCASVQAQGLDSYLNFYTDSRAKLELEVSDEALEDDLIYARIESEYFPEIERRLTDAEERALVETGVTDALGIRAVASAARQDVLEQYNFERNLYLQEKKWVEALELQPSFGNELAADGNFDLVSDLNLLDGLLFGSKAERSDPAFAQTDSSLELNPESWQVGDPRSVQAPKGGNATGGSTTDVYPEGENSITAAIEDLMDFNQKLNAKPLNLEYPTKKFFDTGQAINSVSKRVGFVSRERTTPGAFVPDPELFQLQGNSARALMEPILTRFVATDNRDYFSNLDTQQAAFRSQSAQSALSDRLYQTQVSSIERGGQVYQQDQTLKLHDQMLEHLGRHFESVTQQFEEIKHTFEALSLKPNR